MATLALRCRTIHRWLHTGSSFQVFGATEGSLALQCQPILDGLLKGGHERLVLLSVLAEAIKTLDYFECVPPQGHAPQNPHLLATALFSGMCDTGSSIMLVPRSAVEVVAAVCSLRRLLAGQPILPAVRSLLCS